MNTAIVIATRNRREILLRTLHRLRAAYPRAPIIVVDNGSQDGTCDAVRRAHSDLEILPLAENAGSYARTIGVRQAQTEFVAFCDDDTCWTKEALEKAESLFARYSRMALLCGLVLIEPDLRTDPVCREMEQSPIPRDAELPGAPIVGFLAGASVVRRKAFLEVGGFHRRYGIGGEEQLLALDLLDRGWRLCYVPEIMTYHAPASISRNSVRRQVTILRNALWTAWLRRPGLDAILRTLRTLAQQPASVITWRAFAEALAGIPWILRERRVLSEHVWKSVALVK
jgi:GT2 family glycosyltransferase